MTYVLQNIEFPNNKRFEFAKESEKKRLDKIVSEGVDIIFCNFINTQNHSENELKGLTKHFFDSMIHSIRPDYPIEYSEVEVSVEKLIITIAYTIFLNNQPPLKKQIKKAIVRHPEEGSYKELFKEFGLSESVLEIAGESASKKIEKFINEYK